jgi:hypothetical protein
MASQANMEARQVKCMDENARSYFLCVGVEDHECHLVASTGNTDHVPRSAENQDKGRKERI